MPEHEENFLSPKLKTFFGNNASSTTAVEVLGDYNKKIGGE